MAGRPSMWRRPATRRPSSLVLALLAGALPVAGCTIRTTAETIVGGDLGPEPELAPVISVDFSRQLVVARVNETAPPRDAFEYARWRRWQPGAGFLPPNPIRFRVPAGQVRVSVFLHTFQVEVSGGGGVWQITGADPTKPNDVRVHGRSETRLCWLRMDPNPVPITFHAESLKHYVVAAAIDGTTVLGPGPDGLTGQLTVFVAETPDNGQQPIPTLQKTIEVSARGGLVTPEFRRVAEETVSFSLWIDEPEFDG